MINNGIFNSDHKVELLFGKIVDMHPVGRAHAQTVKKINRLFSKALDQDKFVIGIKDPVTLAGDTEPEPDVYVVRGPFERYNDHHPYAEDIVLLIEVADSTLKTDRGAKKLAYAAAGIQEYWIIDVYGRKIERHTQPDTNAGSYGSSEVFNEGETITSLHLGDFEVDDLQVQYK